MSRERSLTLKVLSAAAPQLALAVVELNRQQRRAARVADAFVVIEHQLHGPPEKLRPWPGEEDILYRFDQQHFVGDGWLVEPGETTLGYSIEVKRCSTMRKGLAKRMLGGWRRTYVSQRTFGRLLVVDDGVPALFLNRKRYSGSNAGLRQMLQDTGWSELQP
ncbi:hypothetical protein [Actinomadura opuntiae]|uniref:hypothetical protein n=1 Tax=Actinomadura sp. OS1-43 TaxID=604315 RepID=UPI00255AA422|nr:hypothetical protein [Actinomadura sp. OS1-43]MDL4813099.1 hypothetical protein [Actinomadura sp. OS1-43]